MKKVTTFLWFDDQAEEAARFYVSCFRNAKIKEKGPAERRAQRPRRDAVPRRYSSRSSGRSLLSFRKSSPMTKVITATPIGYQSPK